jgi:hypothetical protein
MIRVLGAAAMLAAASSLAASEVGLVNHGDKPFSMVRNGERISVEPGSQVRVVYFESGRHETFTGPATFTTGAQQSTVQSGARPQVTTLPWGVPQKISQTPELIEIARLGSASAPKSGTTRARARPMRLTPQQQAEVLDARETYAELRRMSAEDDITPELYLYSVFQDHLLYADMKAVVAEMQRRQPANPDVAVMADYVRAR